MATIQVQVSYPTEGVTQLFWETLTSADTAAPYTIPRMRGAVGSAQADGDFGTDASVAVQVSNNNAAWASLEDIEGDAIALTADSQLRDFSTAALYIRPAVSAGTAEDLDITIILRGEPG